jgi:hypothetical protein
LVGEPFSRWQIGLCVKRHRGGKVCSRGSLQGKGPWRFAKAEAESDPAMSAEFEHLAIAFTRLAEQAERNARTDVTYQPPVPKLNDPEIDR